jgi:serine/threonine protein kinase
MPTKSEDSHLLTNHLSEPTNPCDPATSIDASSPSRDERPEITGYEITGVIAQSDMSFIYSARDKQLSKEVAIKITRYPHLDAEAASRFFETARIEAQLQHPGIPQVLELGTLSDGRPYQVLQLIKGETLSDLLHKRINPINDRIRFLSVFEQLCQIIAYVHSQGVIHDHLKPHHVVIDNFGNVQVIGWGSALVLANKEMSIATINRCTFPVSFSLGYLPPEQARGEWDEVDCRSDVFTLGGILIEILTGRPPFLGDISIEVIKKASAGEMTEAFQRLDRCGEDADLISIAKSCLNPKPELRPSNAGELVAMVSAYRRRIEERVRKSEAERLAAESIEAEKGKRRQLKAALVLVVGLFVIWTGAMIWWKDKQDAVQRLIGTRESDEKQAQQAIERERIASERRARELQDRAIAMQKQKRQQLEREQAAKKKQVVPQVVPDDRIAPSPREVKR